MIVAAVLATSDTYTVAMKTLQKLSLPQSTVHVAYFYEVKAFFVLSFFFCVKNFSENTKSSNFVYSDTGRFRTHGIYTTLNRKDQTIWI